MNTIADLKRALPEGTIVTVTEHRYPALNGERTVVKAQTQRICLSLPAGHPRAAEVEGSWFDIPKRDGVTFAGDSVTIVGLMTIEVKGK